MKNTLSSEYSMSDTLTCKEMWSRVEGYDDISLTNYKSLIKYINPFTGKVKDEFVTYRDRCPIGGSKNFKYLFTKHGFDHMRCNDTGTIFTLQVLSGKAKKEFLEGSEESGDSAEEGNNYGKTKTEGTLSKMDKIKFSLSMDSILKHNKIEIKDIFDFGSAAGTFVEWAQNQNYNIIGHEYHSPLRSFCEKRGLNIRNEDLETIEFDKQFDLITCWDYVDHLQNPVEVINNLSKYLKKGGLFFFAINNIDSLIVKILHEHTHTFIGPHHSVHYGINNLNILMEGYELMHSESYVSELNWISNWCNWDNPEFGDSPLMHGLFDAKKICDEGLGFKLNAIYKKL